MIIVQAGLPAPQVQWAVEDVEARTAVWLDLAWPEHMIGIEFEGATAGGGSTATPRTTYTALRTASSPS